MSFPYTLIASKADGFSEFLSIPPHKPELGRLLDIMVLPEILDYTPISTVKGLSFEGQHLTGLNVLAHMSFKIKISYLSTTSNQTIHSIHYHHLKSLSFEVPEQLHNKNLTPFIDTRQLNVLPFITNLYTKPIHDRCVQIYIQLLVQASMP